MESWLQDLLTGTKRVSTRRSIAAAIRFSHRVSVVVRIFQPANHRSGGADHFRKGALGEASHSNHPTAQCRRALIPI